MAATAFIAKDQRSIPLFVGVCWGYKFKKSTQLEGVIEALDYFFGSTKIYDWIACGDKFDHVAEDSKFWVWREIYILIQIGVSWVG